VTDPPGAPSAEAESRAELLQRLASELRPEQRAACEDAVVRLRRDRALRDALRDLLRSGAPHARFAAAWVLFRAEAPTLRLLAPLLDALELADGDRRWEATQMLAALGRLHAEVYPVLVHEARAAPSPRRRRMALYALREFAPERPETEQVFGEALRDASAQVRRAAFASCTKLAELGDGWVERALAILESDGDPAMRALAPLVLARIAELRADARARVHSVLQHLAAGPDADLARAAELAQRRLARIPSKPLNQ
jgi:hypothetical protein